MRLRNVSIKTKLLFSYLVLIFVPLFILTALTYGRVSKQMETNLLRTSQNALTQSSSYLEIKLNTIENDSDILAFNKTLQDFHIVNHEVYDEDYLQQYVDQNTLTSLINQIQENTDIYQVRLYLRHTPGFYYDNANYYVFKDLDDLPWFTKLNASKTFVTWIAPEHFAGEPGEDAPIVSLARPIRIRNYNVTEGVIRIDMRESVVNDIVRQSNVTATGLSYIVDGDGELISSNGSAALLADLNLRKAAEGEAPDGNGDLTIRSHDQGYLRLVHNIAGTNWKFISIIPYSEIKAPGQDVLIYMIVVLLVTGFVSYLVSYFWFNTSAKRLRHLARNIRKVTGGDFKTHIRDSSGDEIGQISQDFNYMVREMAGMIQERFETGLKIKSLELRALQSQINPHFLYNSLDMINWSAMMSGNQEIGAMVQSLSKFYKIGLSKGNDFITVKNEIEHVKAYLSVQNLRYDNQISLEIDVDEDILSYEVLKITFQPIVENAIQHGILQRPDRSGTIRITGSKSGQVLTFGISDNGVGMSEEKLAGIAQHRQSDEFHGYGIKNIIERITLQYGPEFGISFESTPGAGTKVTLVIPALLSKQA